MSFDHAHGKSTLETSLEQPGPIEFTKVAAADWEVDLGGMVNLDHPKARAAGLEDEPERIQIYFYLLEHPKYGTFMVDSGVARSVAEGRDDMPVSSLIQAAMNLDALDVHVDTKTYLEKNHVKLAGVFLTHLHLDHVLGLEDVPKTVPIYTGPGESDDTRFLHFLMRGTIHDNLEGFGPVRELSMKREKGDPLAAVDVFGDGSLYGLHIPGHTAGSMAFVVRTTEGPKLLTGDGSHTAWGWKNGVEPGSFNTDGDESARSLAALRSLAARHPAMEVHLGHQPVDWADRVATHSTR